MPSFVRRALKRYQEVVVLHIKLIQTFWHSEVPDKWLRAFDLENWRRAYQIANKGKQATRLQELQEDTTKFFRHQGMRFGEAGFESFRDSALERFIHGRIKEQNKTKDTLFYSCDCWRKTSVALDCANDPSKLSNAKHWARVFNWQANSTANERDINKLKSMLPCGRSKQSLVDMVSIVRYGPTHVSELVHRHLHATGEVELFPTKMTVSTQLSNSKHRQFHHQIETCQQFKSGALQQHLDQLNIMQKHHAHQQTTSPMPPASRPKAPLQDTSCKSFQANLGDVEIVVSLPPLRRSPPPLTTTATMSTFN